MKKSIFNLAIFAAIFLSLFAALSSAYHYSNNYQNNYNNPYNNYYNSNYNSPYNYYANGYYDNYNYQSSRTLGYYGGPQQYSSTSYGKTTSSKYLPDGTYETQMHYTKTTRESPNYFRGYSYPRYNYYYSNYPQNNYYPMNYMYSPGYY